MKVMTRFGGSWIFLTLILLFVPLGALAFYLLPLPESGQSGWYIALGFIGFPILILLVVWRMPYHQRTLNLGGSTLTLTKTKSGEQVFHLDTGRAYTGILRIKEGTMGKTGRVLIRWVQVSLEQEGHGVTIDFPINQRLDLSLIKMEDRPGPETHDDLKLLLDLDFVENEYIQNLNAGKNPHSIRDKAEVLETEESFLPLVEFLKINRSRNIWKPAI